MEVPLKIIVLKEFFGDGALNEFQYSEALIKKAAIVADIINSMPVTYGQDGLGDEAIAYIHYQIRIPSHPDSDWYITEKDISGQGQAQAFGLACLGDCSTPELGYISLEELLSIPVVSLDLNFIPTSIGDIKEQIKKAGNNEQY